MENYLLYIHRNQAFKKFLGANLCVSGEVKKGVLNRKGDGRHLENPELNQSPNKQQSCFRSSKSTTPFETQNLFTIPSSCLKNKVSLTPFETRFCLQCPALVSKILNSILYTLKSSTRLLCVLLWLPLLFSNL